VTDTRRLRARLLRHLATSLLAFCLVSSATLPALADGRLAWREDWRRVGVPEYVATGTLFASSAAFHYLIPPAKSAFWTRPLLMDRQMRSVLRLETDSARNVAGVISDAWVLLSVAQPLVIDSLLVAGLGDANPDVALQLELVSAQSYGLTVLLNTLAKRVFARERPYGSNCLKDPKYTADCDSLDRYRSYYSGHSALSATSSGLVCANHTHLPLYGGGFRDTAACLASLSMTLVVGALRIASDRHWATDVLAGHLLGFASGYLLPTLLYYHSFRAKPVAEVPASQREPLALGAPPVFVYSGSF
jgi:membrane-associated phospholipid phosphatase